MSDLPSRWACRPYDVSLALELADGLGLSPPAAAVLVRRGFRSPAEARRFLEASERHDPWTLPGVPAACADILRHVERGSRIAVFGDYDVDGVCSTAMLVRTLRSLGARPAWELPSRFESGYGLSVPAVERLAAQRTELVVTVDCGVTAVAEVAAARAAGMEVVVTDHHRPGRELPDCRLVHPAVGQGYACPELCASGVVLKLSEALLAAAGRAAAGAEADLDLAALATVCDLVPLLGENRRIVRQGLVALARTRKPGLRALMEVAALEPGELSEGSLGFRLGPRLNAAGRMGRADAALELLLTDDESRARDVAQELDLLNRDRQEAETRMLFAAEAECAAQAGSGAIVVAGEGWHPGVAGIVASRLVERWHRPCVAIALEGDSGRGSGRSIAAYDLHAGLTACAGHLSRYGGHRAAAGLELGREQVEPFRRALSFHAAGSLSPHDLIPSERVDAVVPGAALGLELAEELERLRPFGAGNPQPTLLVPAARLEAVAGMGQERQHARFTVATGGARSRGVAFGSPPRSLKGRGDAPHDLVLRLERNRWNGVVEPRVSLRAICPTRPGPVHVLGEDEPFWSRLERELERLRSAGPASAAVASVAKPARRPAVDRRGLGVAGIAGDLLTSGERVLAAVADVPRRRASLQSLVAGLSSEGLAVASWSSLAARAELAEGFDHLLAVDPPPGGADDPILLLRPVGHMAWGPAEAEFALAVWRAELQLREPLSATWRALRELGSAADGPALERALRGEGRHPRSPECCARVVRVLQELELATFTASAQGWSCRLADAPRSDLELSPAYRAARARLAGIERALAREREALPAGPERRRAAGQAPLPQSAAG